MLMPLLVGRVQVEKVLLVDGIGDLTGVFHESWQDLPLSLKVWVGWGVSLVVFTGQDGCSTLSHPMNFGVLFLGCGSSTGGIFGMLVGEEVVLILFLFCLGDGYPSEKPPHW